MGLRMLQEEARDQRQCLVLSAVSSAANRRMSLPKHFIFAS
jgi:hypothetical protein